MAGRDFLCFAEGDEKGWEALCVDLDISIQGKSFDEVQECLEQAVASYVEDAMAEDEDTRRKLLGRVAPLACAETHPASLVFAIHLWH